MFVLIYYFCAINYIDTVQNNKTCFFRKEEIVLLLSSLLCSLIILSECLFLDAPANSVRVDNNLLSNASQSLAQWYFWHFSYLFYSIQVPLSKTLLSALRLFFVHALFFVMCYSKPVDIAPNVSAATGITVTFFMSHVHAI